MADLSKVIVTSSPHIRSDEDTRSIMLDVIIALFPAFAVAVYNFGARALTLTLVTVAACVAFEHLYNIILKRPTTIGDLSAVVTGILLAFNLPVSMPMWKAVIGAGFAIIVAKMLYGGIGKNFMNPALCGRAFLLFAWTGSMGLWTAPGTKLPLFESPVDVVSTATPLAQLKAHTLPDASLLELALGQIGGCIGEGSAAALLAGGLYLLYRRVISYRIPVAFLGTVAILTFCFPRGNDPLLWMGAQLLSGGLMLGAFFMATDYATSPVTAKGQWIFGIGCGLLTVFIRYFGSYPEGVSFAILLMNATVWLIDKYARPVKFGAIRKKKEGAAK